MEAGLFCLSEEGWVAWVASFGGAVSVCGCFSDPCDWVPGCQDPASLATYERLAQTKAAVSLKAGNSSLPEAGRTGTTTGDVQWVVYLQWLIIWPVGYELPYKKLQRFIIMHLGELG